MTSKPVNPFLNPWNVHLKLKHSKPRQKRPISFTPFEARIALSMTQAALAKTLGMSLRGWQNIEYNPEKMSRRDYMALRFLLSAETDQAKDSSARNVRLKIAAARKKIASFSNGAEEASRPDLL